MKYFYLLFFLFFVCGCDSEDDTPPPATTSNTPNILLIIIDDMGKDATQGFSEGSVKPNTPNLNKIKNEGLTFNNFWANPTCSPTRASIITGKYGYRTDVKWAGDKLNESETILQKYLNDQSDNAYATAVVGKWHLSGENTSFNPESLGIDYYSGLIRGAVQDYYQWALTEDGAARMQTEYPTEVFTDLSIDWINSQSNPWFLWLAYNAPHTPFHIPPSNMHSQGDLPEYTFGTEPMPYYMAAIEALDYQIGQLLEGIPEAELDNTIIMIMGDNGTPNQVAQFPYSTGTAKGTLYQGGINVPLIVWGKGVERTGDDDNLICSTDLFSTIAELAGSNTSEINDSKSFKSLLSNDAMHREYQYTEMNNGTDDLWTISNGNYKLIVNANGDEEFYDLTMDPYENDNLLSNTLSNQQENAKTALELELTMIRN